MHSDRSTLYINNVVHANLRRSTVRLYLHPDRYEFEAPQFHDFATSTPSGEKWDDWFEQRKYRDFGSDYDGMCPSFPVSQEQAG